MGGTAPGGVQAADEAVPAGRVVGLEGAEGGRERQVVGLPAHHGSALGGGAGCVHRLGPGSAEEARPDQSGIDHQGARRVPVVDREPEAIATEQNVAAVDGLAVVTATLPGQRRRLEKRAERGLQHQRAVVGEVKTVRALHQNGDRSEFGAGLEQEVVLRVAVLLPHAQVDARVDLAVAHRCVERHLGAPAVAVPDQVVVVARQQLFAGESGRRAAAFERHPQPDVVPPRRCRRVSFAGRRAGGLRQLQRPTAAPQEHRQWTAAVDELGGVLPLAEVGHERARGRAGRCHENRVRTAVRRGSAGRRSDQECGAAPDQERGGSDHRAAGSVMAGRARQGSRQLGNRPAVRSGAVLARVSAVARSWRRTLLRPSRAAGTSCCPRAAPSSAPA